MHESTGGMATLLNHHLPVPRDGQRYPAHLDFRPYRASNELWNPNRVLCNVDRCWFHPITTKGITHYLS